MHSAFKRRPRKSKTTTQRPKISLPQSQPKKTSHQHQHQHLQPASSHNGTLKTVASSRSSVKSSVSTKLWLREVVGDEQFAREVQSLLGEETAKKLLRKIKKRQQRLEKQRIEKQRAEKQRAEKQRVVEQQVVERAVEQQTFGDQTPIYVVTPTYRRPEQQAELTRLAQTLMHVPNLYWLLVEDAKEKTTLVASLLQRWKIRTIHLNSDYKPPPEEKLGNPRGVNCRNRALKWIRENVKEGVLYFADDDNTYDIELFSEIRSTKKVSMFPVGLVTQIGLSTPIVRDGKFVAFCDGWMGNRKFPVDMAGFAVNINFLSKRPNAQMPYREGQQEDMFLKSLAPFEPEEIELKANNCTKLLVWHTQTVDYRHLRPPAILSRYPGTNLVKLMETIVYSR